MSISEIIEMFGGRIALAFRLKIDPTAIDKWIQRDTLPLKYWKPLIKLSKGKLTPQVLLEACNGQR